MNNDKILYSVYYAGILMAICTTKESANKIRNELLNGEELEDENLIEIYPIIPDKIIE